MALSALLGALTIGSSIGLMATSAYIIASAALHPSIADLAVPIVGVRFFGIARGVFRYLERLASHHVNFSLLAQLRVWFYRAIEPLAPARLMSYRSGDLLSRVVGDIETLQNFFIRIIAPPVVAALIALLMFIFLYGYAPALAWIVLLFMILAGVVVPAIVQSISRSAGRRMVAVRSELSGQLIDGIQGSADLIAFGQEHAHQERVSALSRELIDLQKRMASLTALHNALGSLLSNLAMWAVLVIAIPLANTSQLNGVYLPVLALATLSSFEGVLALPLAFQYLEANLQAARRLFEMVDISGHVSTIKTPRLARRLLSTGEQETARHEEAAVPSSLGGYELRVQALSFRYAKDEPLALERIDVRVKPGQRVAIVGPSGAGKSTLVNVLLRFWDYAEGHIYVGGADVRGLDPERLRALIGVVSQHTHLFNASVRENLLMARPDADESELVRAAQQAQIHDFIQSLPRGYDTLIGEQGLRLSGGERQRLAIARALLKDAPIIVLDEATANLDPVTEREVMEAVRELTACHTTLIITHRLVGLEDADEIIVLDAGRIVERGRHTALIERGGVYRRMWELQQGAMVLEDVGAST
jgi:thiol reductant ABC exporter CydC subunit